MTDQVRIRLVISGRVQGVGFRYFTLKSARGLGLGGWVRNEPDGSVLCEVQGEPSAVRVFAEQVRRGPGLSRVEDVTSELLPLRAGCDGEFAIS